MVFLMILGTSLAAAAKYPTKLIIRQRIDAKDDASNNSKFLLNLILEI